MKTQKVKNIGAAKLFLALAASQTLDVGKGLRLLYKANKTSEPLKFRLINVLTHED